MGLGTSACVNVIPGNTVRCSAKRLREKNAAASNRPWARGVSNGKEGLRKRLMCHAEGTTGKHERR